MGRIRLRETSKPPKRGRKAARFHFVLYIAFLFCIGSVVSFIVITALNISPESDINETQMKHKVLLTTDESLTEVSTIDIDSQLISENSIDSSDDVIANDLQSNTDNNDNSVVDASLNSDELNFKRDTIDKSDIRTELALNPQLYYSANEMQPRTELIDYSYANELQLRKDNFEKEMKQFSKIANDLLYGNTDSFQYLSRYYAHPSKFTEYSREYIINKWVNENVSHIDGSELTIAHPHCPVLNETNFNSVNKTSVYFTHNCCNTSAAAHEYTAHNAAKFDSVLHYTKDNITNEFKTKYDHILSQPRGAGYWLWKPYIILNTVVNIAQPCDIVCYCDTGARWMKSAEPLWHLTSRVKYGTMLFNHLLSPRNYVNLTERWYSKRDAFVLLGVDTDTIYDTMIRKATFSCYQSNPDSINFLIEWLFHSMDERIITDKANAMGLANIDRFKENRHDQTVMSLLSKKYGIPAFTDPSHYGDIDVINFGKRATHWDVRWIIKHSRLRK